MPDRPHLLSLLVFDEEHHTDWIAFLEDFRELVVEEEFEEYTEMQEQMVEFAREALGTNQQKSRLVGDDVLERGQGGNRDTGSCTG